MKKNKAFSLVELLLVIAIIAIIGSASFSVGGSFLVRSHLRNKTQELVSFLYSAQINSSEGKEDSRWGVAIDSGEMILFKGDSFVSRDSNFDEKFIIPSSISITTGEIVFNQFSGEPQATANFTVTSNSGDSRSISVNQLGAINVN